MCASLPRDWRGYRRSEENIPDSLHADDRRAPSSPRRRFVVEGRDVVAAGEQAADLRALDALAAAMSEPHGAEAAAAAFVEVLGDDGHHVARRERMEVELAGDGEDDGLVLPIRRIRVLAQRMTRTSKVPELST